MKKANKQWNIRLELLKLDEMMDFKLKEKHQWLLRRKGEEDGVSEWKRRNDKMKLEGYIPLQVLSAYRYDNPNFI